MNPRLQKAVVKTVVVLVLLAFVASLIPWSILA